MTNDVSFASKTESAVALVEKAKAVVVTNAQEHAAAGAIVDAVRAFEKELEAEYKAHPVIIEAKKLQGIKGYLATMLETARKTTKGRQMQYEDAQEVIRRAEKDRLAAIAKKEADDAALAAAQAAQSAGDKDTAIAILEQAIAALPPVVVIPRTSPKTAMRRMVKKFEVTNEAMLPRQYLQPNLIAIGGVVRSLGLSSNIPGVRIWEESC